MQKIQGKMKWSGFGVSFSFSLSVNNLLNLNALSPLTYKSVMEIQKNMFEIINVVTILVGF